MALNNQWIPPTINFINPDPICDLDYVPNIGRSINFEIAVKQSVGFGGQNGVLIIKKWPN
jgi:3-oxoacyl-[acyl-carrier-protein] synthase II